MTRYIAKYSLSIALLCGILPQSPAAAETKDNDAQPVYQETLRPQFHYTVKKGWINDPCGLVHYKGQYHLFNDHNPFGNTMPGTIDAKTPSRWSHAVSPDLVHWTEMPIAVMPDEKLGAIFSGSGVVDHDNTSGLASGDEKPLVLVYTLAGRPFSQGISYSNDSGKTWTPYAKNPVVPNQGLMTSERDPRVFWHEPTKRWVMVLYVKRGIARFFTSEDLKTWTHTSDFKDDGFHECPDLFQLPLDGDKDDMKWILYDAKFKYYIGTFDGKEFKAESGPFRGDFGRNFYAAQTWTNTPGKTIQIAWMNGGRYPGMPFNQQQSFPCELTLETLPEGVRICRRPIDGIKALRTNTHSFADKTLNPVNSLLKGIEGDLFEIEAEIEPLDAATFGLSIRGEKINYTMGEKKLSALGAAAEVELIDGRMTLHVLVDRASIEVFANDGRLSMTSCFIPEAEDKSLAIYSGCGQIKVISLKVHELKSIWPE